MVIIEFANKINKSLCKAKAFLAYLESSYIVDIRPDIILMEQNFFSISRDDLEIFKRLEHMGKLVDDTIKKRDIILRGIESHESKTGRFLIYSPLHAMMDALADGETDGFFDEADAPPYTTWLGFLNLSNNIIKRYEGYLIAWIPSHYIFLANQGVDVSLGQSLFWADDIEKAYSYGTKIGQLCESLSLNFNS